MRAEGVCRERGDFLFVSLKAHVLVVDISSRPGAGVELLSRSSEWSWPRALQLPEEDRNHRARARRPAASALERQEGPPARPPFELAFCLGSPSLPLCLFPLLWGLFSRVVPGCLGGRSSGR